MILYIIEVGIYYSNYSSIEKVYKKKFNAINYLKNEGYKFNKVSKLWLNKKSELWAELVKEKTED